MDITIGLGVRALSTNWTRHLFQCSDLRQKREWTARSCMFWGHCSSPPASLHPTTHMLTWVWTTLTLLITKLTQGCSSSITMPPRVHLLHSTLPCSSSPPASYSGVSPVPLPYITYWQPLLTLATAQAIAQAQGMAQIQATLAAAIEGVY